MKRRCALLFLVLILLLTACTPAVREIISTEYLLQNKDSIYEAGWRELDECIVQWSWRFVEGQADLDADWETYLEELDALGLQQVIDIYQVALDRFNET